MVRIGVEEAVALKATIDRLIAGVSVNEPPSLLGGGRGGDVVEP